MNFNYGDFRHSIDLYCEHLDRLNDKTASKK